MVELSLFNVDAGYNEAICRGLRASFLKEEQYTNLKNCNNMSDVKMVLEDTDYQVFIQNEPSPITVSTIKNKMKEKLASEIAYLAANSSSPFEKFFSFIAEKYMIDNVVILMEGAKNKLDKKYVIAQCDPLGYFPEMEKIIGIEDDLIELYKTVLIDTAVAKYFQRFIEDFFQSLQNRSLEQIKKAFNELSPEETRTVLKKMWIEDFHEFCVEELNPLSQEIMNDLLKFEADCLTLQVIYNTISTKGKLTPANQYELRKKLCPSLGYLYPECSTALEKVTNLEGLRDAVKHIEMYHKILSEIPDPEKDDEVASFNFKSLDESIYEAQVKKYSMVFDNQFHAGGFFAYIKLKEQEIRNVWFLSDMVYTKMPRQHPSWKRYQNSIPLKI